MRRLARVTPTPSYFWTNRPARWLMSAVVLVFGLGWQSVSASSLSSGQAINAEEHAHYCKCATCRGASCCCGKSETRPLQPSRAPAVEGLLIADSGPCLNSTPCNDPLLPGTLSTGTFGGPGILANFRCHLRVVARQMIHSFSRCTLPARRAFRLDEPPEHLAIA
jgi:hypothetical protein